MRTGKTEILVIKFSIVFFDTKFFITLNDLMVTDSLDPDISTMVYSVKL